MRMLEAQFNHPPPLDAALGAVGAVGVVFCGGSFFDFFGLSCLPFSHDVGRP